MKHIPLTLDDLREIQNRNLDRPDVMRLLREIKRLRGVVATTYQLLDRWGETDRETLDAVESFHAFIQVEPCVAEEEYEQLASGRDELAQKRSTRPRNPGNGPSLLRTRTPKNSP